MEKPCSANLVIENSSRSSPRLYMHDALNREAWLAIRPTNGEETDSGWVGQATLTSALALRLDSNPSNSRRW